MWYLSQLSPAAYNVTFYDRLHGALQVDILERALNAIVGRHEVLRTLILSPGGKPVAVRLDKWKVTIKRFDLRNTPPEDREAEAHRLLVEESSRPFNLARDLLLRAVVIQLADEDFIFLHDVPHLAFDGSSIPILLKEISFLYNAALRGSPPQLPVLSLQYSDFALWQHRFLQGERLEALMRYWSVQLKNCPRVKLPGQYVRPEVHSMRGARRYFVLPPDLLRRAKEFFHSAETTPYRGLCACFFVFLHAYTGQTDLCAGSPFAPRCAGIENLIGFFVNTVVLRVDLSGQLSFHDVLKHLDTVVREAIQHSDLTFNKLVEAANPARDPSSHALFQVNFRAPKKPYPSLELVGIRAERTKYVDNKTSKFDLALEIETSLGDNCYFEYYTDLFSHSAVEQMVTDFIGLVRALITEPGVPLANLKMVRTIRRRLRGIGQDGSTR